MPDHIKVIDLFAGPGGLGEGFSAFEDSRGERPFKIALSIEKETSAHRTLELRAFYRQFDKGEIPSEYYDFLSGKLGRAPRESLFKIDRFREQAISAKKEARQLTLGVDNQDVENAIRDALGKSPGNWVLIGGPPCQAYSLVGRARNAGNACYRPEDDQRNFLYREYLKIIQHFRPSVFVMENVKGILSAYVGGERIFAKILDDLHKPGMASGNRDQSLEYHLLPLAVPHEAKNVRRYSTKDFIVRAENHGIPQARHRVILLGVRSDLPCSSEATRLVPVASPNVEEAISDLPRLRSGLSREPDGFSEWVSAIRASSQAVIRSVRSSGLEEVAKCMARTVENIGSERLDRGSVWAASETDGPETLNLRKWIKDPVWSGVCNHETRGHMRTDLMRYLFCACYAQVAPDGRLTPRSVDFPPALAPAHRNWHSGKFADRFRVQAACRYASTITSHISKDGHYFIHYDPCQCRSLTVREAARLQTFPDNYFFLGNRTQQYVQVGNAVPPFLALQMAKIVFEILSPVA
ncbi:DNA cytosine methyltransferase [Candidatus Parcubacteria bacterium]|nr:MAG: DNA cytosine methyltransferase [Candidatus Parcubacteria bacterium]